MYTMNTKIQKILSQHIGILGLGDENIALVNYLIKAGADNITVCDQSGREELQANISKISTQRNNINFRLGESYLDKLENFDIIFRSPGLPYLNEKIQDAKNRGVIVSSAIKLFFDLSPSPIIGVTGTKGKGTTSTLISEILKCSDKLQKTNIERKIFLAGNIGNSPLEFLDNLTSRDIVILELSSFQLQDMDISPHVAVVLDVKSDHLNYHKNQQEYISSKENIVKHQNPDDIAIINFDYATSQNFAKLTQAKKYWFSRKSKVDDGAYVLNGEVYLNISDETHLIAKASEITLRGNHNLENICASITAARLVGADIDSIQKTIKSFPGLEHRLEFIKEKNNIKFYNDSFSTTPDTAIAAIKSFTEPIILIAGGSEKNADYSELAKTIIDSNVKTAILIGQTGPRITKEIRNLKIENRRMKIIDTCKNINEVICAVKTEMKDGDVVLLSPASASFDWFRSYKDRGVQFKRAVEKEI
jgi:UDP-N-acetylmuramoylalanine--D-glutamate ligase